MDMKCMLRWENRGEWRGPFDVLAKNDSPWLTVRIDTDPVVERHVSVPLSWTLGGGDGWTLWEGGERPVDARVEVITREATIINKLSGDLRWHHNGTGIDIIAYRIVEQPKVKKLQPLNGEPKTLDQAWDEDPPLSVILDRSLWWECGTEWVSVDRAFNNGYYTLSNGKQISHDWFTDRLHLTAEELAEELEG